MPDLSEGFSGADQGGKGGEGGEEGEDVDDEFGGRRRIDGGFGGATSVVDASLSL